MDFAKNLLGKYGWKEGDGLGKNNDGINAALKPNYKFDKSGLGHSQADDLNNHWWENVFNNAANNMTVTEAANGSVEMGRKSSKSVEITTKNYSIHEKADTYYRGQFLKTSTLINASEEVPDAKSNFAAGDDADADEVVFESVKLNPFKVVADEELFRACNGRTAHKGARHGLTMSGKLARIEAQERELLARMQKTDTSLECNGNAVKESSPEFIEVKKRKHSKKDKVGAVIHPVPATLLQSEWPKKDKSKKNKKKTRKLDSELSNALAAISTTESAPVPTTAEDAPKKKHKKIRPTHTDDAPASMDISKAPESNPTTVPKSKSQKRKHIDLELTSVSGYGDTEIVGEKVKKSKKSKRNVDDKQSTTADDFVKAPAEKVVLSTRQLEKQERKRQRQVRRLAKEMDTNMQISD